MKQTDSLARIRRRQFIAEMGDWFILPKAKDEERRESKWYDGKARELAEVMAETQLRKNNVRSLESLAWSTDNVGDILDYIRIRTGRDTRNREWGANSIGASLADALEKLRDEASSFSESASSAQVLALHLELCREFIKHLVAYFEFQDRGGWKK